MNQEFQPTVAPPRASWLREPLNTLPRRQGRALVVGLTALVTAESALVVRLMESPFWVSDARQYLHLAQGRVHLVPQPFASRQLAPLLVRAIAALLHVTAERGFLLLGLISLVFTLLAVFGMALRSPAPRWLLLAMAALPLWPVLLHHYALPDLWYAALLCGLLLFLAADRLLPAALMLFPLMVSRESTSLTLLCLLAVGWRRLRLPGCVAAVAATAAGSLLVRHLSAGAAGNPEHLPELVYLPAKAPWNLARNLGIVPWSNMYPYLCSTPRWLRSVHLGPVHSLGVCAFSPVLPFEAVFALGTTFGLLPWVAIWVLRSRRPRSRPDLLLRFCLLYGAISIVLSPLLGTSFARLFGYAWPLFLVALPWLFPPPAEAPWGDSPPGSPTFAAVCLLLLQVSLVVLGLRPANPPEVLAVAVLSGLGIVLLYAPLGAVLRPGWGGEAGLQRGKLTTRKTPQQADFS